MKRIAALLALSALIAGALVSPASSAPKARVIYGLEGEGRGLELSIADQGVTLGLALARGDSSPSATGVGAGQCTVLGNNPNPNDLPCNEATIEQSSTDGNEGEPGQACAAPALPAPLDTVVTVDLACGSSVSNLLGGTLPVTSNEGKVAELGIGLDLSGLVPQAEDAKEQLIDQLQEILEQAPEQVRNALNQLLDALDEGQAVQILAGPASSNITADGPVLKVESSAAGAVIGAVGIPDLNDEGLPIPGTADATEDGLIIIEVGKATASASVRKADASSSAESTAAIVNVKVRDITQTQPTYQEIPVAPGQSVTILEGTPAESTITAAVATKEEKSGSAVAAADAVRLHLLKGVEGGVQLGLGRATAAVTGRAVKPDVPRPAAQQLPRTGGTNLVWLAFALIVAAGVVLVVRRRFTS